MVQLVQIYSRQERTFLYPRDKKTNPEVPSPMRREVQFELELEKLALKFHGQLFRSSGAVQPRDRHKVVTKLLE